MNYGKAIKVARSIRDMSQRELAKLAELDASYVSLVESGRRTPSMPSLEAMAAALRVPMYLLILMASGPDDLRGVPEEQADALGRQLLDLILASEAANG